LSGQPEADTAFVGEGRRANHRAGQRPGQRPGQRETHQRISSIQRGGEDVLSARAFHCCASSSSSPEETIRKAL
jgi:hypothetical protein